MYKHISQFTNQFNSILDKYVIDDSTDEIFLKVGDGFIKEKIANNDYLKYYQDRANDPTSSEEERKMAKKQLEKFPIQWHFLGPIQSNKCKV